jgi:hypothetical protein
MRYRGRTFLSSAASLAGIAVVSLGACGKPSPSRADAPRTPPTQSSVPNIYTPPPSAAPVPAADRSAPLVAKPANRNAKNTPTSRLCWAQAETSLLLVNSMMSSDANGVATAQLIPTLDTIDVEVAALQRDTVDPLVAPFLEQFATDLRAARAVWTAKPFISSQDLVNGFDFENYPAIKEFVDAAKGDPGCVGIP